MAWSGFVLLSLLLLGVGSAQASTAVIFSAVLPLQQGQEMFLQVGDSQAEATALHSTLDRCIHDRSLPIEGDPLDGALLYRYGK